MKPLRLILAGVVLGLISLAAPLHGQSTEAAIKDRLQGKPLYLKGFWGANKLSFDADGKLIGRSDVVSFTVSGFEFESVHLKNGRLVVEGKRVGTEFLLSFAPKRVYLKERIKLEIASPSNSAFGAALDAIFVDGLPALAPSLPPYWQAFARCHLSAPDTTPDCSPYRYKHPEPQTTGKVTAPRSTTQGIMQPQANEYARRIDYSGITSVGFTCGADGVPLNIIILQPTGIGLDEQALAGVARYRFAPAMRDGKPIAVDMILEVPTF